MPVSRKRKKKTGKSGRPQRPAPVIRLGSGVEPGAHDRRELADVFQGLAAFREQMDARKTSLAAAAATDLVAELTELVANEPDMIVEDTLCTRLGTLLSEAKQAPIDDRPGTRHLADALVAAAVAAVETAIAEPDAWRAPWRVLTAVTHILPWPHSETAAEEITRLRGTKAGRVLPAPPPGPAVTGTVLWARDRYGSRFAIAAPITTADQPMRWYLWDIDACGHDAFTVHSGFYPTAEAALAAWQAGVGEIAAAGTGLAPVDDPGLLRNLLPTEDDRSRTGGENEEQFAEYHRGRRLAEVVKEALPRQETPHSRGLDRATATVEFVAWLRERADQLPEDLDELVTELADSWCVSDIAALFPTCSPHRVALFVSHVRGYYLDDFADQLVALLPDWTRWLAARNGTPPELADRCIPYAQGKPNPQITDDDTGTNYFARIIE